MRIFGALTLAALVLTSCAADETTTDAAAAQVRVFRDVDEQLGGELS